MSEKKRRELIQLYDGCYCSQFSVYPPNWNRAGASLKKDWYIFYRFYDPAQQDHPRYHGVKPCQVKGMNSYTTLGARRQMTEELLRQEREMIIEKGYNPITRVFMKPDEAPVVRHIIPADTGLAKALQQAFDRLEKKFRPSSPEQVISLRTVLTHFNKAAAMVRQDKVPIDKLTLSSIILVLDQVGVNKGDKWTNANYNFYRSKLMMLFKELMQVSPVEINFPKLLETRKVTRLKRKVLTEEECLILDRELRKDNYRLWLIMHLFFHSGARTTEFLRLKVSDINLQRMEARYLIKKDKVNREEDRPLKEISLPLWEVALIDPKTRQRARPDQYIFSVGLVPGNRTIRREQISRRWRRWVKKKYNGEGGKPLITADWYSLKYLNTTQLSEIYDEALAARLNKHSVAMTKKHYDVGSKNRMDQLIRGAGNAFAPRPEI